MNEHGVDIEKINYQDNGNWSVFKKDFKSLTDKGYRYKRRDCAFIYARKIFK